MKFRTVDDEAETGLRYETSEDDRTAIFEWIDAAERTADWVVATLHVPIRGSGDANSRG